MADNITERTITILAEDADLKTQIRVEGAMRGHNISEASLEIVKLGLPLYLKQFPKTYNRGVEKGSKKQRKVA